MFSKYAPNLSYAWDARKEQPILVDLCCAFAAANPRTRHPEGSVSLGTPKRDPNTAKWQILVCMTLFPRALLVLLVHAAWLPELVPFIFIPPWNETWFVKYNSARPVNTVRLMLWICYSWLIRSMSSSLENVAYAKVVMNFKWRKQWNELLNVNYIPLTVAKGFIFTQLQLSGGQKVGSVLSLQLPFFSGFHQRGRINSNYEWNYSRTDCCIVECHTLESKCT